MNQIRRAFSLAVLGAVTATAPIRAQCSNCRLPILMLTPGARAAGLAGSFVTGDGPAAMYYNPAQVGSSHGSDVSVQSVGGAALAEFATTGTAGRFGIGAGVRFLNRDRAVAADSANIAGGALVAGVGLASQIRGIWIGAVANLVQPDLGGTASGAAFDVGAASRRLGLLFGLAAQNLGSDPVVAGVRQELPTRVTLGAGLPDRSISTYFDLGASAAVSRERDGKIVPKVGAELTYEPISGWDFTARIGIRRVIALPGELRESALSLGATFNRNAISIDYAFRPAVAGGKPVHAVGLRIR